MRYLLPILLVLAALAGCERDEATYVTIDTPFGRMRAVLYDETPRHRDNFVRLAEGGFYDSLLFHRVVAGFMIQGGDPDSRDAGRGEQLGVGGPGYTLPAEIGAPHIKGALAAARFDDRVNPARESSGSQFYIVQGRITQPEQLDLMAAERGVSYNETQRDLYATRGGAPQLDGDYTVFGELVEGYEVLDRIAAVETDLGARPVEDVRMRITVE